MRVMLTGLVAAALLGGPLQAAQCLRPNDLVALDVTALKTQLMVTALTCQANDKYNAFITKYKTDLQREDKSLNAYFSRAYGRSASKQRDDYVTQLANSHSQIGVKQGSLYCAQNVDAFDEVLALRSNAELTDYAAGRTTAQPIELATCGPEQPVDKPVKRASHRRRS